MCSIGGDGADPALSDRAAYFYSLCFGDLDSNWGVYMHSGGEGLLTSFG